MTPHTLAFACFWATPVLARDYDVLIRCGRVQAGAHADGHDTPAGWFARAARSYSPCDDTNRLAARTCTLVSAALADGVPS